MMWHYLIGQEISSIFYNKLYYLIYSLSHKIELFKFCRYLKITPENRHEYVRLALDYRLHEFDAQVAAVREGLSKVVPVPLLALFSGAELETMVCGSPDIPLNLLKSVATYKGTIINLLYVSLKIIINIKYTSYSQIILTLNKC